LSDVYEIARSGSVIQHFPVSHPITGLAWNAADDAGKKLYIFGHNAQSQHAMVSRMNPFSGQEEQLVDITRLTGDRAGGCAITAAWNSTLLVFAGILQGTDGDRLGIWELDFNTSWISITPTQGTVADGIAQPIQVNFNPQILRDGTYHANLTITNNSLQDSLVIPVTLTTTLAVSDRPAQVYEYALAQNYPNPFNNSTMFRYELAKAGKVLLRVFNITGQEVATLVNSEQSAGIHVLNADFSRLATGIYLYRLDSGNFHDVRKFILLR
jgi:hypothetical protein